jgi:hypothetical protein
LHRCAIDKKSSRSNGRSSLATSSSVALVNMTMLGAAFGCSLAC